MWQLGLALMLVAAVVVPAAGVAATTPARRCASAKLKAAGSTASGLLGCHASAVKRGAAVDPTCLGKAHAKLTSAFSRAEAKGGCASAGDAGTVTTTIDGFADGIATALADGGTSDGRRCAAVKLKAAGKKASTKLGCHARAVTKLAVADPTCLSKAETKFTSAFVGAESVSCDCSTTS